MNFCFVGPTATHTTNSTNTSLSFMVHEAIQLQPLRPNLCGIFNVKYNDHSWALSLISLQGCYLRIAKSVIAQKNVHELEAKIHQSYFSDKYDQV
jgi:hypothetical protein